MGELTAIHLSLICMTVRLQWTDRHTFVSYLCGSRLELKASKGKSLVFEMVGEEVVESETKIDDGRYYKITVVWTSNIDFTTQS